MPGSASARPALAFRALHPSRDDAELALLRDSRLGRGILPDLNLFIGSGLFDYKQLAGAGIRIALATDVGGGTSHSMLRTAAEAYKVMQVQGQNLPALVAFDPDHARQRRRVSALPSEIGTITPRRLAPISSCIDARATPAMAHHMAVARDLEAELFVLMTLGDDRAVRQTYIAQRARALGEASEMARCFHAREEVPRCRTWTR